MEKELQKFIESDKTLKKEYGTVLTDIGALYKEQIEIFRKSFGTYYRVNTCIY